MKHKYPLFSLPHFPKYVWFNIFSFISAKERLPLRIVNKKMREFIDEINKKWETKFQLLFPSYKNHLENYIKGSYTNWQLEFNKKLNQHCGYTPTQLSLCLALKEKNWPLLESLNITVDDFCIGVKNLAEFKNGNFFEFPYVLLLREIDDRPFVSKVFAKVLGTEPHRWQYTHNEMAFVMACMPNYQLIEDDGNSVLQRNIFYIKYDKKNSSVNMEISYRVLNYLNQEKTGKVVVKRPLPSETSQLGIPQEQYKFYVIKSALLKEAVEQGFILKGIGHAYFEDYLIKKIRQFSDSIATVDKIFLHYFEIATLLNLNDLMILGQNILYKHELYNSFRFHKEKVIQYRLLYHKNSVLNFNDFYKFGTFEPPQIYGKFKSYETIKKFVYCPRKSNFFLYIDLIIANRSSDRFWKTLQANSLTLEHFFNKLDSHQQEAFISSAINWGRLDILTALCQIEFSSEQQKFSLLINPIMTSDSLFILNHFIDKNIFPDNKNFIAYSASHPKFARSILEFYEDGSDCMEYLLRTVPFKKETFLKINYETILFSIIANDKVRLLKLLINIYPEILHWREPSIREDYYDDSALSLAATLRRETVTDYLLGFDSVKQTFSKEAARLLTFCIKNHECWYIAAADPNEDYDSGIAITISDKGLECLTPYRMITISNEVLGVKKSIKDIYKFEEEILDSCTKRHLVVEEYNHLEVLRVLHKHGANFKEINPDLFISSIVTAFKKCADFTISQHEVIGLHFVNKSDDLNSRINLRGDGVFEKETRQLYFIKYNGKRVKIALSSEVLNKLMELGKKHTFLKIDKENQAALGFTESVTVYYRYSLSTLDYIQTLVNFAAQDKAYYLFNSEWKGKNLLHHLLKLANKYYDVKDMPFEYIEIFRQISKLTKNVTIDDIDKLLELGSNIAFSNKESPLFLIDLKNNMGIFDILVCQGANINALNAQGMSSLVAASFHYSDEDFCKITHHFKGYYKETIDLLAVFEHDGHKRTLLGSLMKRKYFESANVIKKWREELGLNPPIDLNEHSRKRLLLFGKAQGNEKKSKEDFQLMEFNKK